VNSQQQLFPVSTFEGAMNSMRKGLCGLGLVAIVGAAAAESPIVKPDPLLVIDQNRATVVNRVVATWGEPLAKSTAGVTPDQLR